MSWTSMESNQMINEILINAVPSMGSPHQLSFVLNKLKIPKSENVLDDPIYTASQKHESTLLHTYVLNEFLTADRSCIIKYF